THNSMPHFHIISTLLLMLTLLLHVRGQSILELGGAVTAEYSHGAGHVAFYWSEVPRTGGRLSLREVNAQVGLNFHPRLSFRSRILLAQNPLGNLNDLQVAQANLQWRSKSEKLNLYLGRFLQPFGRFYSQPLPQDRVFISRPLTYNYYINISEQVGYTTSLDEPQALIIDGRQDWGAPSGYFYGYGTGIKGKWDIKPDTLSVELALVQSAPISSRSFSNTFHPTLVFRTEFRPGYFWRQGISFSRGGFLQSRPINASLSNLSAFTQTMIGTDVEIAYGHFEIGGELVYSWYRVPFFNDSTQQFVTDANGMNQTLQLQNLSGYVDIKYELPFWVGSYLAYRWEFIAFGEGVQGLGSSWDDNTNRNTLLWGYKITRNLTLKVGYSWQEIDTRDWALGTFRAASTLYF
ncbi:MAG: hypothetical protein AAFR59_15485, partial [Bacteroidota bacterium]